MAISLESWTIEGIEARLVEMVAQELNLDPAEIGRDRPFSEMGLDSVSEVVLTSEIENWLDGEFSPSVLWDYPTIAELARHLATEYRPPA